jgi:hypothetical protein
MAAKKDTKMANGTIRKTRSIMAATKRTQKPALGNGADASVPESGVEDFGSK